MGDKPYAIRHGLTRSPPRRPRRPWPRTRDTVSASPGRRENTTPPPRALLGRGDPLCQELLLIPRPAWGPQPGRGAVS